MSYDWLKDPKFWTGVADAVVSLLLYFVGKYGAPGLLDDLKFVIGALQPVFLMVIIGLTQRDVVVIRSGNLPTFLKK